MDELLQMLGYNLKYDDLTQVERETFHKKLEEIKRNPPSIADEREHIRIMKESVERELTKTTNTKEEDILLKARLRNYSLLDAFLVSAEKAEKALKNAEESKHW